MAVKIPTVAIVGRANVGKSSLFNRLTGRRQAITHDQAGTTRDSVTGELSWGKTHFQLLDTAGLERPDDEMAVQIQDQVAAAADVASVIIVVVDAETMITDQDLKAAKLALKTKKPVILAINKMDTVRRGTDQNFAQLGVKTMVGVSSIHGEGTGDLLDAIVEHLGAIPEPKEVSSLKLALIGRPNVGKSSLLNSLAGKQQAVVSPQAGTTRDVRSIDIKAHGQDITLLDTAGLRRRGKIEKGVEKYSATRTSSTIEAADICMLLIDAGELSVAGDHHIAGMIKDAGKGLILVINKWDSIEKDDHTQGYFLRKLAKDFSFVPWAPVVFVSALTGEHVTQLLKLAVEIYERRNTKIATGPLNAWLEATVAKHPPAGLKNRQPKINYMTQTGVQPPTFTGFASHPEFIHFSYKRYLENSLREKYDFIGTPIVIEFRDKRKEKA
jgi:GTP-binding protein